MAERGDVLRVVGMSDMPTPPAHPSPTAWAPPPPAPAMPVPQYVAPSVPMAGGAQCPVCGTVGQMFPGHRDLTTKQRRKFGVMYVLLSLTLIGFPIAVVLWLMAPRKTVVVGVDRFMQCRACGAVV